MAREVVDGFLDRRSCGGMYGTRAHVSWSSMLRRCQDPKHHGWKYYGARGVRVCAEWTLRFKSFYRDMGPRPAGRTLDRIDNDGGYTCGTCAECVASGAPMNCRWATIRTQNRNKRKRGTLVAATVA